MVFLNSFPGTSRSHRPSALVSLVATISVITRYLNISCFMAVAVLFSYLFLHDCFLGLRCTWCGVAALTKPADGVESSFFKY